VKDSARFPGGWAFFAFGNGTTAKIIPLSRDCYSCHAEHGAVDTTFVQFYPTLATHRAKQGHHTLILLSRVGDRAVRRRARLKGHIARRWPLPLCHALNVPGAGQTARS